MPLFEVIKGSMCPTLEDIFFFFFFLFRQQLYLVAAVLAAIIMFLFASFTAKVSSLLCGRWDNDFLSESSFLLQLLSLCTHCNSLHVCWTWMSESSSLQPEYHVGLLGQPSKICLTFFEGSFQHCEIWHPALEEVCTFRVLSAHLDCGDWIFWTLRKGSVIWIKVEKHWVWGQQH